MLTLLSGAGLGDGMTSLGETTGVGVGVGVGVGLGDGEADPAAKISEIRKEY